MEGTGIRISQASGTSRAASSGPRSRRTVFTASAAVVSQSARSAAITVTPPLLQFHERASSVAGVMLQGAEKTLCQARDVVIFLEKMSAVPPHLDPLLGGQPNEPLDRVGGSDRVVRGYAEAGANLAYRVVRRGSAEDDGTRAGEVIRQLVEGDAVSVQGQVMQAIDEGVRLAQF